MPYRNVFGENFEETRRRVPDIRRAAEILGFRAQIPLEEGLKQTIAWFRQAWPRHALAPGRTDLAGFFDPSSQESKH